MNPAHWAIGLSIALFAGMMLCLDAGFRIGRQSAAKDPAQSHEGVGAIEAAIFALLGLLLGFTFAGATSRLDARRQLIISEANAIGTAYLRLDLVPTNEQAELRGLFRNYIDSRLRAYEKLPDRRAFDSELEMATQTQQQIWARSVIAAKADNSQNVARLLLPALNEMIDVTTARSVVLNTHLPGLIFALLIAIALLSALVAGYALGQRKNRTLLHMLLYAAVISMSIYAVLDLEYPRFGLIHLERADRVLVQLRDSIR